MVPPGVKRAREPMEPHQFHCRYKEFTNDTLPLTDKHTFIMLTNLTGQANISPHFWPLTTFGHVYCDYEFWLASSTSELPYVLCRQCFMRNNCPVQDDDDDPSPMSLTAILII